MRLLNHVGATGRIVVLDSVMRYHRTYGRCTIRAVAADTGKSVGAVHWHLRRLRDLGLVAWDDETQGTLHPTCAVRKVA